MQVRLILQQRQWSHPNKTKIKQHFVKHLLHPQYLQQAHQEDHASSQQLCQWLVHEQIMPAKIKQQLGLDLQLQAKRKQIRQPQKSINHPTM